jgi:hypothetical protein
VSIAVCNYFEIVRSFFGALLFRQLVLVRNKKRIKKAFGASNESKRATAKRSVSIPHYSSGIDALAATGFIDSPKGVL